MIDAQDAMNRANNTLQDKSLGATSPVRVIRLSLTACWVRYRTVPYPTVVELIFLADVDRKRRVGRRKAMLINTTYGVGKSKRLAHRVIVDSYFIIEL